MAKPMRGQILVVRRIIVSAMCALVAVIIASRVNRTAPVDDVLTHTSALDEVLPEVEIDGRSLRYAIQSIRRASKTPIIVDASAMAAHEKSVARGQHAYPPMRFRNVSLRAALSVAMDEFDPSDAMVFRENEGTIVVESRDPSPPKNYCRVYDVRELFRMYLKSDWPENPYQQLKLSRQQAIKASFEQILSGVTTRDGPDSDMCVWCGWLFVRGNRNHHQHVEEMSFLLRRQALSVQPRRGSRD